MRSEPQVFTSTNDVFKLNFIDFARPSIYPHIGAAVDVIFSYLNQRATYIVIDKDTTVAPERSDFPNWRHPGRHVEIARHWWNWFKSTFDCDMTLSDQPDFYGTLRFPDRDIVTRFWGDFGKVGPATFVHTIRNMESGNLWISVPNARQHIIIEPLYDVNRALADRYAD